MKCRLHKAPLAKMMLAFAGQEPFAEQDLGPLERAAFCEICLLHNQDLAYQIGMRDEIDILAAETKVNQIAVLAGHPH
jgi:hypothetical protein